MFEYGARVHGDPIVYKVTQSGEKYRESLIMPSDTIAIWLNFEFL